MKKFLVTVILIFCFYTSAFGQNSRSDGIVLYSSGRPVPAAQVVVCFQPATGGVPCTNKVPLCSSLTDTSCVSPNPVTGDGNGNYFFYVPSGIYTVQFFAPGISSRIQPDQSFFTPLQVNALQMPGADIGAQVNAACIFYPGHPSEVIIPAGSYTSLTQINPTANCWIHGQGKYSTTIVGNLGANPVIKTLGVNGTPILGVRISDLSITNGTPVGTPTAGKDGIRLDWCTNCTVERTYVHSIQGNYGIVSKDAQFLRIVDNDIINFAYAGIETLSQFGANYIWIERNTVDTSTKTTSLSYGIGSCDHEDAVNTACDHVRVLNNAVRNIPHFTCIDSHGGHDFLIQGNSCTNTFFGIVMGPNPDNNANNQCDGFHIKSNNLVRGSGDANGYGIVVNGVSPPSGTQTTTIRCTDIIIDDNEVQGFGSSATSPDADEGAIQISHADGAQIINNRIPNYYQSCINLFVDTWNTDVSGNVCGDVLGAKVALATTVLLSDSVGNWGVHFCNNKSKPFGPGNAPNQLFRNTNASFSAQVCPDNVMDYELAAVALWGDYIPVGPQVTKLPSSTDAHPFKFQPGGIAYDKYYRPSYSFQAPAGGNLQGYYSFDSTSVIATGTISLLSPTTISTLSGNVTICGATTLWYDCFPRGMNITIAGAGIAGANLNAQVLANDGLILTIDTAASTAVVGANITWQAGAAQMIQAPLDAIVPWYANCTLGCQFGPSTNEGGFGITFSSDLPYLVANAYQDAPGTDHWKIPVVGTGSLLLDLNDSTLSTNSNMNLYFAAAGTTAGTFAHVWGSPVCTFTGDGRAICIGAIKGTSTLTNVTVNAGACQTTVTTASANVLGTDAISWAYASAPVAASDGLLIVNAWPTAGGVNFQRCNPTAGNLTPTALVINWFVPR